ncbi:hypothetical protein GCM10007320_09240 [Pseudorhodoferax aquiterrae]|uniref:DUF2442 domain-containing protein n=1 Tax=Pseudorhodoferax aquiterrae TaxID=747304 RepID=A0ABQ3FXM4_9BURK|nr:hypothetical protein [Pseudorhodoferax aquiterrae]GHC72979.1 hypothetical protein GCM10007320_09240 [Pseudorhodoferax aquiterrae]
MTKQTITIEVADDEVLVAIKRGEHYDDVHPDLVLEDFKAAPQAFDHRVVWPATHGKEGA